MKTVIQIVLIVAAIILAYLIYQSVERPILFEKAKDERYDATVQRLKDIRKAQLAFKDVNGRFTGDWDTLITFVKQDSLPLVRKIGMLTDSMIEAGVTEEVAIKKGLIIRDTIKVGVLDTLFGRSYPIEDIKMIPVQDTVAEFHLGATVLTTGSGIKVPVFEAKAHNNTILKNLDKQLVINLNDQRRTNDKYPGLKVGSLTETNNNAGNWE
ncbi:hypothetical protein [Sunxiuqinia elliptica]|uniref:Uncharacterized protein n=1 Tax=Sunxiuqinia elliptica TaxID=655355 RepID=A0A1I2ILI3_9BACT|nr:hypothetical protein [Sunxiuqinia elliptica]TDN97201.1 hypothetical protein DET52_110118 [Sunxiuqinia elliptica]TDO60615.1 hypothetical protein DET65_2426 [Sunxiuqinia elliptica]SFF43104.1 hypothetical protein SAMN05216283_106118 [Sunxiuqinia elliptica]